MLVSNIVKTKSKLEASLKNSSFLRSPLPYFRSYLASSVALLLSCQQKPSYHFESTNGEILIQQRSDTTYRIASINQQGDSTFWELPYPVYQCKVADINGDGSKEVIVGVIKPTRFDSVTRKRVFVYKQVEDVIRPLWLGSRLGMPLEDFSVMETETGNRLFTIEQEAERGFAVGEYEWDRFGFKLIRYVIRNCSFREAKSHLNAP